jgi:hypothetical protein
MAMGENREGTRDDERKRMVFCGRFISSSCSLSVSLSRSFHLYFWEVERAPEIEMKRRGKDIPGIHPSVVSLDY